MAIFSDKGDSFEHKPQTEPRKKPGEGPFRKPNSSLLRASPGVCARNFRVPDSKFALRVFGSYKAIGRSSVSIIFSNFIDKLDLEHRAGTRKAE